MSRVSWVTGSKWFKTRITSKYSTKALSRFKSKVRKSSAHYHLLFTVVSRYRRRVLCFLLLHVISHPFPSARIALLRSIESVSDFPKPHMLLPVMKSLMEDPPSIAQAFGTSFGSYLSLVVAGFLSVTATDLARRDDNEMQDWTFVDKKGTVRCWRWRGCS